MPLHQVLSPRLRDAASVCLLSCMLAACASVHPEKDYARAAAAVSEQVGVENVFDPTIDAGVASRVAGFFEDGLTLEEATQIALLNNRGFQAMFYEIGVSRADVVQSALLTNPGVSLSIRFPEGGGRSNVSLGFAQELIDLWQIPLRKRIAEDQLDQVVFSVVDAAENLTAQAREAYFRAASAIKSMAVARENLVTLQESVRLAEDRFRAGESTILDLNLLKAAVSEERVRLRGLERDQRLGEVALARVLGLVRERHEFALVDSLPETFQALASDSELMERAFAQRFDVQASERELDAAEAEIQHQLRALFPSIAVGIDAERSERRASRSLSYNPLLNMPLVAPPGQTPQDRAYDQATQVGDFVRDRLSSKRERDLEKRQAIDVLLGPSVSFTLPLWDQNQAQIAKARLNLMQKQKQHEDLLDDVAQGVRQAIVEVRNAVEQAGFYQDELLPQAERNVDTAKRAYEAGEEDILALLEAQRSLVRQREAYVEVLAGYTSAAIELERVIAGPLTVSEPPAGAQ